MDIDRHLARHLNAAVPSIFMFTQHHESTGINPDVSPVEQMPATEVQNVTPSKMLIEFGLVEEINGKIRTIFSHPHLFIQEEDLSMNDYY